MGSVGGCWCQWGPPHTQVCVLEVIVQWLLLFSLYFFCFVLFCCLCLILSLLFCLFTDVDTVCCSSSVLSLSSILVLPTPVPTCTVPSLLCTLSAEKPTQETSRPLSFPSVSAEVAFYQISFDRTHILRKCCMLLWTVSVQWDCPKFIYQNDDRPVSRCSEFGKSESVSLCSF